MIRKAIEKDAPRIADLADAKRRQYEAYQPVFHRPAANAKEMHESYLKGLVGKEGGIFLVFEDDGEVIGFIIAEVRSAPPVYDPGGKVCYVDDFVVADQGKWGSVGRQLLEAALRDARAAETVLGLVVCGPKDAEKRAALVAMGFDVAAEWFVKPLKDFQ